MNNSIFSYLSSIDKIDYYDNHCILYSNGEKYYYQKANSSVFSVIDFLKSKQFSFIGPNLSKKDYLLYSLLEEKEDYEFKKKELIRVLAAFHELSMEEKIYSMEEKKKQYDIIYSMIDSRMKYYLKLQDQIDEFSFPSPAYYLLIKNISKVYRLLHFAFQELDKWFQGEEMKYHEVFLMTNVSLDHFHFGETSYFYDYGEGERGVFIDDLVSFFQKDLFLLPIKDLFHLYQEYIPFTNGEKLLFLCLFSIPEEISFQDSSFQDTIRVRRFVDSIDIIQEFLLEENKENQEADQEKFKEENNDIDFRSDEDEN